MRVNIRWLNGLAKQRSQAGETVRLSVSFRPCADCRIVSLAQRVLGSDRAPKKDL